MHDQPRTVTVVCANSDTLRELVSYLESAGLEVSARSTMRSIGLDPTSNVVVFFPDEFPTAELEVELERLRENSPHVARVIVTKHPRQFADEGAVVIPKPAWGWTIVDAIHMRSQD